MQRRDDRIKKSNRLMKIYFLLYNNPFRFTTKDLADRCEVSQRTIYRDLKDMESELDIPLAQSDDGRLGFPEGTHLPPIRFSINEALSIFLAMRLIIHYAHQYDPHVEMTFEKLSSVLPETVKNQVQKTLDWMHTLPQNSEYSRIQAELARAWINQKRCIIFYQQLGAKEAQERKIEPYFIEPAATGHASYVIAYCHHVNGIRIFRVGRIKRIKVTEETFRIPENFDANKYFSTAWGITVEGDEQLVKLRFSPEVARLIEETVWHPSETKTRDKDGSLIMTIKVMNTIELFRWILSWGNDVEVLEPEDLRKQIVKTLKAAAKTYQRK